MKLVLLFLPTLALFSVVGAYLSDDETVHAIKTVLDAYVLNT